MRQNQEKNNQHTVGYLGESSKLWNPRNAGQIQKRQSVSNNDKQGKPQPCQTNPTVCPAKLNRQTRKPAAQKPTCKRHRQLKPASWRRFLSLAAIFLKKHESPQLRIGQLLNL